jgi:hypothetical protein
MKYSRITGIAAAGAGLLALAACGSSSSTAAAKPTPAPCNTAKSAKQLSATVAFKATGTLAVGKNTGTETLYGLATGKAAMANAPAIPLTATGVVASTGHITLGGPSSGKGVLVFKKGNMNVVHTNAKSKSTFVKMNCTFTEAIPGTYKVTGGTGSFAGATGHGTYTVTFVAVSPRKK